MRRRRGMQSARDYTAEVVGRDVQDALMNRWRLLSQFPLGAKEVWETLIPPEIHKAANEVKAVFPSMLRYGNYFSIDWDEFQPRVRNPMWDFIRGENAQRMLTEKKVESFAPTSLQINLPSEDDDKFYIPRDQVFTFSHLPQHMKDQLIEWANATMKYHVQAVVLHQIVTRVFYNCNTMGQVKRVWPNLMNFFPLAARQKVEAMVKQSKLPEGFEYYQVKGEIFDPAHIEQFDMIITEALILPKTKLPEIGSLSYN